MHKIAKLNLQITTKLHKDFQWFCQFSRTIRFATSDWLSRGIMWKRRQIKCRAIRNYTWVWLKWPKMWIKRLHAKIHNIITIYIHYRTIYFKTITCIILIIVISSIFACKTHTVFNDFVDYCVTGKRNRTGARALWNGRIMQYRLFVYLLFLGLDSNLDVKLSLQHLEGRYICLDNWEVSIWLYTGA